MRGKAPGVCGIHPEMLWAGGQAVLKLLHGLYCSVWTTGVIPSDFKKGLIVPTVSGKGRVMLETATTTEGSHSYQCLAKSLLGSS